MFSGSSQSPPSPSAGEAGRCLDHPSLVTAVGTFNLNSFNHWHLGHHTLELFSKVFKLLKGGMLPEMLSEVSLSFIFCALWIK